MESRGSPFWGESQTLWLVLFAAPAGVSEKSDESGKSDDSDSDKHSQSGDADDDDNDGARGHGHHFFCKRATYFLRFLKILFVVILVPIVDKGEVGNHIKF